MLLLHVVQIVLLGRLLDPSDFGIAAMAGTVFAVANQFKDFGFSVASIQSRETSEQDYHNLFWIGLGMAFLISAVIIAVSPFVGWFYGDKTVRDVVISMSVTFLVGALGNQPIALAQKKLLFSQLAKWGIAGRIVGLSVGCLLAWRGFGPWAIVAMGLVEALVRSFTAFLIAGYVPGRPRDLTSSSSQIRFGAMLTSAGLISCVSRNVDQVIIGRAFGAEVLGLYTRAHGLLVFPLRSILSGFTRLNLATMSRVNDNPVIFNQRLRQTTQAYIIVVAMLIVPAVVVRTDLIEIAMGKKWLPVVPIFVVLAPYAWFQVVAYVANLSLISTGRMAALNMMHVLHCIVMVAAMLFSIPHGIHGVALAYSMSAIVIQQSVALYTLRRATFVDIPRMLRLLAMNVLVCGVGFLSASMLLTFAVSDASPPVRLGFAAVTAPSILICLFLATDSGRKLAGSVVAAYTSKDSQ